MKPRYLLPLALAALCATPAWTQVTLNPVPSRTAGHPVTPLLEQGLLYSTSANLVEGRELYSPRGVAVDTSVSPSPVYVADTYNNRVLGWRDATAFVTGQTADIVIGQNDFFTTWPEGPTTTPHSPGSGSPLQAGLTYPTGLAALNGDLYVVDTGNNRVLRFPKPIANASKGQLPDLVIGQPSFTSVTANYTNKVSAKGIFLSNASNIYASGLAFDANGNLWVTDPGNRRVLEFAQADLANGGAGIAAVTVLGQSDMVTVQTTSVGMESLGQFAGPSGIAIDSAGRIYVTDSDGGSVNRVLAFVPSTGVFTNGQAAANLLGLSVGQTTAQAAATALNSPLGMFCLPGNAGIGVVDAGNNRILVFQRYDLWPVASSLTATASAQAAVVVGQGGDFTSTNANNTPTGSTYTLPPTASVFNGPTAAVIAADQLFVADAGNNRVLAMPIAGSNVSPATRVLGQDRMDTGSINLIEGRELQLNYRGYVNAGIAIDSTGPVQRVYVADTYNNRILAFRDLRQVTAGARADLVIGQPNGQTALCNYPSGDAARPTASSLCSPVGLVVDSAGNLWVADRGNGRVLRFPAPFSQTGQPQADLVLGQSSLTSAKIGDATSYTMSSPYGVAVSRVSAADQTVKVAVSDQSLNRVLVFQSAAGGVFNSGQTAAKVIGQSDFRGSASGSGSAALYAPHHIALDASDRLYVADFGNNRVTIYDSVDNPQFPAAGASAVLSLTKVTSSSSLNAPAGIYVNPSSGEIWVADTYNGRYVRYPDYLSLLTNQSSASSVSASSYALALAQDAYGALLTADGTNRIALYFPGLTVQNLATTIAGRPLAPGAIASAVPVNTTIPFGSAGVASASQFPLPTDLQDLQVLFGAATSAPLAPAPLFMVSPFQVNFYVPMGASSSGAANIEVVSKSTGQVYSAGTVAMNTVSPSLFVNPNVACTSYTDTSGVKWDLCPAAVINHDNGQPNSPTNPAKRNSWIELYGTGQGFVTNAPADGQPATGLATTPSLPQVALNGVFVNDASKTGETFPHIYYSGLTPGYAGLWQINVLIPNNVAPGTFPGTGYTGMEVDLIVTLDNMASYDRTQKAFRTKIFVQ